MVSKLKLKGNDLLVFSLIHGFTQDGVQKFNGSAKYICEWTGLTKPSVYSILKKLTEKGYIEKTESVYNNVKFCEYKSLYELAVERVDKKTDTQSKNFTTPSKETLPPPSKKTLLPSKETLPNIYNIYNNKDIDNRKETPRNEIACEQTSLFPKEETVKEKKTLFRNSVVGKWDIEKLDSYFSRDEITKTIDWGYYKIVVSDWSEAADRKRTKKGWIATIHQFVRSDKEKGKLKLKPQYQQNNKLGGFTYAELIDPLKGLK